MKNRKKLSIALLNLIFAAIFVSGALPSALAEDSPQYIASTYAVDSAGNPVTAVITPTANEATIYIAATTQVANTATVTQSGFSCLADGQPRVNLNTVSAPINTIVNPNSSITYIYKLTLMVPDNLASPAASFVFYTKVVESGSISEITHESTPLQFSVEQTSTATSTPTPEPTLTATLAPTDTPNASPTVPEFPFAGIAMAVFAAATVLAVVAYKKTQVK